MTTQPLNLYGLTDRELSYLAFQISELLVEREMLRRFADVGAELAELEADTAHPGYSVKVA